VCSSLVLLRLCNPFGDHADGTEKRGSTIVFYTGDDHAFIKYNVYLTGLPVRRLSAVPMGQAGRGVAHGVRRPVTRHCSVLNCHPRPPNSWAGTVISDWPQVLAIAIPTSISSQF